MGLSLIAEVREAIENYSDLRAKLLTATGIYFHPVEVIQTRSSASLTVRNRAYEEAVGK